MQDRVAEVVFGERGELGARVEVDGEGDRGGGVEGVGRKGGDDAAEEEGAEGVVGGDPGRRGGGEEGFQGAEGRGGEVVDCEVSLLGRWEGVSGNGLHQPLFLLLRVHFAELGESIQRRCWPPRCVAQQAAPIRQHDGSHPHFSVRPPAEGRPCPHHLRARGPIEHGVVQADPQDEAAVQEVELRQHHRFLHAVDVPPLGGDGEDVFEGECADGESLETEVVVAGATGREILDSEELVDGVGWASDDQSTALLGAFS